MWLLFVHMLTNECISTPAAIWEKFKQAFFEDFYLSNGHNWNLTFSTALLKIVGNLYEHGKTPDCYGLPQLEYTGTEVFVKLQ